MSSASGRLTIDLDALRENYKILREKARNAEVAGVVKANAYGIGVETVAPLLQQEGCRLFFVATPEEGIQLRGLLPDAEIAILDGLYKDAEDAYREHGLIPVIGSFEALERAGDMDVIFHFDTGMNRLGFKVSVARAVAEKAPSPRMIMSHFACADDQDHVLTHKQYERFADIANLFLNTPKSLCNSASIFQNDTYHYDIVRPGMALYGLNPTPWRDNPMRPTAMLEVQVLQVHEGKKGETAGYGASYLFEEDTKLATVAMGYADGFHRILSNRGKLFWNAKPCPVVGRVSMDTTIVDLSYVQDDLPQEGDWMEVFGPHQSADDLANDAGTIGYEILTSLGDRWERIYKG